VECLPAEKCREHTSRACLFICLIFMNLLIHCRAGRKTKRHNKATKCGKQNNSACRGHCGGLSSVQQLVVPCVLFHAISRRAALPLSS
ncbi:MAG: hypothetical protein E7I27_24925, partial [Klebsiella michiganensis]|nr:hypothetical protein [Klebsiella michiganensis]